MTAGRVLTDCPRVGRARMAILKQEGSQAGRRGVRESGDPRRCGRCTRWVLITTDGNGHVVMVCDCGWRMRVRSGRPAPDSGFRGMSAIAERRPIRDVPTSELANIAHRIRHGRTLLSESRALGYSHNGPLRAALLRYLGKSAYSRLMAQKAEKKRARGAASQP